MRLTLYTYLALGILLGTIGCVYWTKIESPILVGPNNEYKLKVPKGWIHASGDKVRIVITKDSPLLQRIEIRKFSHNSAFRLIETEINQDTLVTELAEYYVANYKKLYQGFDVKHLETKPATIDGHSGFRLHMEYANQRGLIFNVVVYGFANKDGFFHLLYQAPKPHYFDKDLQTFEGIVESFSCSI